jgi:hypothetical protein
VSTPYHGYHKNLGLALSGKMDAHFTALWEGGHIKFFSIRQPPPPGPAGVLARGRSPAEE